VKQFEDIIGYALLIGSGFQLFSTFLSVLCYEYSVASILNIQPSFLGTVLFLIFGLCYAGFNAWLGIKILRKESVF